MITIVFWNISKNQAVLSHLDCLAQTYDVDIFILAECPWDLETTAQRLSGLGIGQFRQVENLKGKTTAIVRLQSKKFVHRFTSLGKDMAVWALSSSKLNPPEVLIAGIHLTSKAGGVNDTDQALAVREVVDELNDIEDQHQHRNTILVGDFNMHPYDSGMTSVAAVHGLMTTKLATAPDRVYKNLLRRRFYNPMWGFFGDRTPGPAGSYYWRSSVPHNPHWTIFDQVLLRPAVINALDELQILDGDGFHALTTGDGAPNKVYLSDHLPVLSRFDF